MRACLTASWSACKKSAQPTPREHTEADRRASDWRGDRRQDSQTGREGKRSPRGVALQMFLNQETRHKHRQETKRDRDQPNRRNPIENGPKTVDRNQDQGRECMDGPSIWVSRGG